MWPNDNVDGFSFTGIGWVSKPCREGDPQRQLMNRERFWICTLGIRQPVDQMWDIISLTHDSNKDFFLIGIIYKEG